MHAAGHEASAQLGRAEQWARTMDAPLEGGVRSSERELGDKADAVAVSKFEPSTIVGGWAR